MSAAKVTPGGLRLWRPLLPLLLSVVALGAIGCESRNSEELTPQAIKVHNVRILYPSEARRLMMGAIDRFNAKNLPLSNGAIARLTGASFDDYAATGKIGSSTLQASLWIPPLSALAAEHPQQSEREVRACASLMSTQLGVAMRSIDTFILPAARENLSITSLLTPPTTALVSRAAILHGSPRFSSSGLSAAVATVAELARAQIDQVTPQTVSSQKAALGKAQDRVRNYSLDDQTELAWLAGREGGDPLVLITTDQAVRAFKVFNTAASLEWFPLTSPAPALDYPLCDITTKNDSPEDAETVKLAQTFLSSDEFKALATEAGFSPPSTAATPPNEALGVAIRELITEWPQIRRPASTVFVVDTSIKTDLTIMETIRREISLFVNNRPSKSDLVALVSASSNPEVLRDPTSDPELLSISISRFTTSGGNAIRDGMESAFTIFEDSSSTAYRRSIIVFTSAKDTSSQTTVEQLTNRATQLVGRKNVDLFVIALGGSEEEFGELPTLTRKVGGRFVLTDIASLPGVFYPIARRVQ